MWKNHMCKGHMCKDFMWKDQRAFSLVEVIIVIALIAVLAGSSVALIGHIRYANTKKVAEEVDKALSRLRLETMSRDGQRQFLYIYRVDNNGSAGYYIRLLGEDIANPTSELDGNGTRLCGTNVTFSVNGKPVSNDAGDVKFICIAFKKNGLLDENKTRDAENIAISGIVISGNGTYTIRLDSKTGRHFLE